MRRLPNFRPGNGNLEIVLFAALALGCVLGAAYQAHVYRPPAPPRISPRRMVITTQSLPEGHAGTPYRAQLNAEGGRPPYKWTVIAGALPKGLSLSPEGLISGTASRPGEYIFTIQVEDAAGETLRLMGKAHLEAI